MAKKMQLYGEGYVRPYIHARTACRALIERDGKILASVEHKGGLTVLPGGGKMRNETPAACAEREVLEESGYIVKAREEFLIIYEYYDRSMYETHFFICEIEGVSKQRLTSVETENKLVPEWRDAISLQTFFKNSARERKLPAWKRRVYRREYHALTEYLKRFNCESLKECRK